MLTNERRVLRVLTNERRVLMVLTNERRVLKVLANERRVLPAIARGPPPISLLSSCSWLSRLGATFTSAAPIVEGGSRV